MSIDISDAELERLSILSEECGEVTQAISKMIRFGKESVNPKDPEGRTNREHLCEELGNVYNAMVLCAQKGDVDFDLIRIFAQKKKENLILNHQEE